MSKQAFGHKASAKEVTALALGVTVDRTGTKRQAVYAVGGRSMATSKGLNLNVLHDLKDMLKLASIDEMINEVKGIDFKDYDDKGNYIK